MSERGLLSTETSVRVVEHVHDGLEIRRVLRARRHAAAHCVCWPTDMSDGRRSRAASEGCLWRCTSSGQVWQSVPAWDASVSSKLSKSVVTSLPRLAAAIAICCWLSPPGCGTEKSNVVLGRLLPNGLLCRERPERQCCVTDRQQCADPW